MLKLEKRSEKTPMMIDLNITMPFGMEIEKIFGLIKKIDEERDSSHVLHLKINYEAYKAAGEQTFAENFAEFTHSVERKPF